mmetsp:Transcript_14685/g.16646  ORF Transcript_14685/g.16646 Transcript_14685/m.16646 type:complete len:188 (-) Transcript_14685:1026-1589(-)
MATTVQMNSITDAMNLSPEERKKNVTKISLTTGLEAAFKIGIVSIPTALVLTKYWKPFTRNLGVSGRTAVAIIPPLFAFGLVSEQVASRLASPEAYASHVAQQKETKRIAIHHQIANYAYNYPIKTLVGLSIPMVGGIFAYKGTSSHLNTTQRVLHTRVLGQASVLSLLVGTMLFHDYMDRHGPYTE